MRPKNRCLAFKNIKKLNFKSFCIKSIRNAHNSSHPRDRKLICAQMWEPLSKRQIWKNIKNKIQGCGRAGCCGKRGRVPAYHHGRGPSCSEWFSQVSIEISIWTMNDSTCFFEFWRWAVQGLRGMACRGRCRYAGKTGTPRRSEEFCCFWENSVEKLDPAQ